MRVLTVALILACGVSSYASDPPPDARARAALSLAKSKASGVATIATAPAPRPAVLDYPEAKRLSLERSMPVVVFVGCDPIRVPEALTASVDTMDGIAAGTVLICYPSGGNLWADAQMPCPAKPADLEKAVRDAGKKVDVKPKKLDWS